jgi:hypothetical protein
MTQTENSRELVSLSSEQEEIQSTELVAMSDVMVAVGPVASLMNGLRDFDSVGIPIHEQMLTSYDVEMQETLVDVYQGTVPRAFKEFAGETVDVLGIRVFEHAAFTGKDKVFHPEGYFQLQILLNKEDEKGRLIVLKSSSVGLAMHAFHIMQHRGWYVFESGPVSYKLSLGPNNEHIMYNVSSGKKLLQGKGKVGAK